MNELLEQFALLDNLLNNWDSIRVLLGKVDQSMQQELVSLGKELSSASSLDDIALLIDNLLDLIEETPAYTYVTELIDRASLDFAELPKTRSLVTTAVGGPSVVRAEDNMQQSALLSGEHLGHIIANETESCRVSLYFATNRQSTTQEQGYFTGEHQEQLTYGNASVTIPVSKHRIGHLEQRPWWQFYRDKNDPRRYVVLHEVETITPDIFEQRLASDTDTAADLLVFLHGYNVTFEEAARRAAQFSYDMEFKGRTILYSWPSLGQLKSYAADEERAFLAAECFHNFLHSLEAGPWRNVHVVAHSMGNRVMLLGLCGAQWPNHKLSQIVFVAADVYVEVFEQKFPQIREKAYRYSSYVSKSDRALQISSLLHKARRIGISSGELFSMNGLETIDASELNTSLLSLGHGYFAEKRSVITDLGNLIRNGLDAAARGLHQSKDHNYWMFQR